jgi:hypothetical protein
MIYKDLLTNAAKTNVGYCNVSKHKLQTCRLNLADVNWMRLDQSCQWHIVGLQMDRVI